MIAVVGVAAVRRLGISFGVVPMQRPYEVKQKSSCPSGLNH